ncbi:transcriptional activator RfaH [Luteitalea pratensis]|uniref:Transcriptional activator RfaH n=1 Tax=Luteitalea pratensis TaxID=1855912 RepID=A0A143PXQ3_LUTPR|nr:UpxY family transcription antiterminator [Luteitalea pratensis]AMY12998.1 transcriptional activator RfaH [Luteitalea pratensis]
MNSELPDSPLEWFALRVKPRTERVVTESLAGKCYETFLPLHTERRRWSDRVKTMQMPLFAGYVFCRFDVQHRLPILTTPGVLHVVSTGQIPQPIDDEEIESLRLLVESGLPVEPWPFHYVGQRIRIIGGPLAGTSGILQSVKSKNRLIVSISLLQRSVAVEVPESSAWPASA